MRVLCWCCLIFLLHCSGDGLFAVSVASVCCECGNYSFRYSCECLFLKVYRLFALGDDDCVDCECVRDIEEMFTRVLFIFCIVGILALWSFCFVLSFLFWFFFLGGGEPFGFPSCSLLDEEGFVL